MSKPKVKKEESQKVKMARKIKPYPRKGTAWIYKEFCDEELRKNHAVIENARFGACGYQDYLYGLTIELKEENGRHMSWTFYSMEDIYELMQRTKSTDLKSLRGKPMFGLISGFNRVAGVDVNDDLILDEVRNVG